MGNVLPFQTRTEYDSSRWAREKVSTSELTQPELTKVLQFETLTLCSRLVKLLQVVGPWDQELNERSKKLVGDALELAKLVAVKAVPQTPPSPPVVEGEHHDQNAG